MVRVAGVRAMFNYNSDIAADVQAKCKGTSFVLRSAQRTVASSSPKAAGAKTASVTGTPAPTSAVAAAPAASTGNAELP